ncbi:OmpA family protein [Pseudoroseomonas globiformis]|uniref:OmpA family protein n=1 Tax=Teichococcus globiformis TaxID=2307229 RepID=A0ABV7G6J5_9PROT
MQTRTSCAKGAADRPAWSRGALLRGFWRAPVLAASLGVGLLAGCALPGGQGGSTRAGVELPMRVADAPKPSREAQSLDDAVRDLTVSLFDRARIDPPTGSGRYDLVIDPLIDRATGSQNTTTRGMETRMAEIVRTRYPDFALRPFGTESLAQQPIVLMGAITAVAGPGIIPASSNARPGTYRIWAVLGDLRTGKVVSHETAWVRAENVDPTPTAFFRDSPAWAAETITEAYLQTCARDPGEPIDPRYLEALQAQAQLADGIRAYEAGRYEAALVSYEAAAAQPGGDALKARNGAYLSNRAMGRADAAEQAFGRVVDYGLDHGTLAVKFLFRPGTTAFWPNREISGDYPMWLRQIAERSAPRNICLDLNGHASPTGATAWNERLSLGRAQTVRQELVEQRPVLAQRTEAQGLGASMPLIGTGTDDLTDALDRRVEFITEACPIRQAAR